MDRACPDLLPEIATGHLTISAGMRNLRGMRTGHDICPSILIIS